MVQGINKEYIFKSEEYIEKYIEILGKKQEESEIKIIAYCIMNISKGAMEKLKNDV